MGACVFWLDVNELAGELIVHAIREVTMIAANGIDPWGTLICIN
jgi:hypothetical protein